jgi:fructose-1,6-bisphosphatase I
VAQLPYAAKILSREIGRAALTGNLGFAGDKNATSDTQKKLDVYTNDIVVKAFGETKLVAGVVSEELEEVKVLSCESRANYILCIDPLDGSSNTDINGAVGTIFGVYRRRMKNDAITTNSFVKGLARSDSRIDQAPERAGPSYETPVFSAVRRTPGRGPLSRLMEGGLYFYPADADHRNGKLRFLYECAPLAFVVEQAGGRASTGEQRILDLQGDSIHQRVPLVIGSTADLELYERFLRNGSGITRASD